MTNNPHAGSDIDYYLREEGLYKECSAIALRQMLLCQLAEEIKRKMTKIVMVARI
jgi:hypothetical protein